MNYTEGKWESYKRYDGEWHVGAMDLMNNCHFVANCGHTGEDEVLPYNKEAIANAQLIAAAPEMYEALKEILFGYESGNYKQAVAEQAKKALAKAEGKL